MNDGWKSWFVGAIAVLLALPAQAEMDGMKSGMTGMGQGMAEKPAVPARDERSVLSLTAEERAIILEEMRGLLTGTRLVVDGLVNDDMKAVAAAARTQGMHVMHGIPASLKAKLPMEFKQLGMGMHGGFDQMALDADSMADPKQALRQLNTILQQCVACHGSYQIQVTGKK